MVKDKRYATVKKLIAANLLGTFGEILVTVPKTTLARDLGMHHDTLNKYLDDPLKFTFEIAVSIAALIEVDEKKIIDLLYAEIRDKRRSRKGK